MTTRNIRRELTLLVKRKQATCTTDKERNHAVNQARQEINAKYGHGWRDNEKPKIFTRDSQRPLGRNPQHFGTDIPEGDEWYHWAQTADDF